MESGNTITLSRLTGPSGYMQSATVTFKITRVGSTTAISGASGTMTLDSGSVTGDYSAKIAASVINTTNFTATMTYWVWYTANDGTDSKTWRCDGVTRYADEVEG